MFETFTDRARKVMQYADREARRLRHEYIGTEHVLLGLIFEGSGIAAEVLKNLDVDLRVVRLKVQELVKSGIDEEVTAGKLPKTPSCVRALQWAAEEALLLHRTYVGTEHLLLGLLHETDRVAAKVLTDLNLTPAVIRDEITYLLGCGTSHLLEDPEEPEDSGPWPQQTTATGVEVTLRNTGEEWMRIFHMSAPGKFEIETRIRLHKEPTVAPVPAPEPKPEPSMIFLLTRDYLLQSDWTEVADWPHANMLYRSPNGLHALLIMDGKAEVFTPDGYVRTCNNSAELTELELSWTSKALTS